MENFLGGVGKNVMLLAAFLVNVFFAELSYGYTYAPAPSPTPPTSPTLPTLPTSTQPADPYYEELVGKFPKYKKTIDSLYGNYSGWIIDLSQKYGIAPLLAM